MKFIIERSKWLRGEGMDDSALMRARDGKCCCLGLIALQCGIEAEEIKGVQSPSGVHHDLWDKFPEPFRPEKRFLDSPLAGDMMPVNDKEFEEDESEYSDAQREAELTRLASGHGIELEFVD